MGVSACHLQQCDLGMFLKESRALVSQDHWREEGEGGPLSVQVQRQYQCEEDSQVGRNVLACVCNQNKTKNIVLLPRTDDESESK